MGIWGREAMFQPLNKDYWRVCVLYLKLSWKTWVSPCHLLNLPTLKRSYMYYLHICCLTFVEDCHVFDVGSNNQRCLIPQNGIKMVDVVPTSLCCANYTHKNYMLSPKYPWIQTVCWCYDQDFWGAITDHDQGRQYLLITIPISPQTYYPIPINQYWSGSCIDTSQWIVCYIL